ncbi:MAG TPA: capsid protein [Rhodospirillaceae bacterium]|nr:capsid protein [Rhodospirillaceae bacterium]|tara:strand:- start:13 stop:120 length:108 start_codon:yes stop_codon:yes gene_type:complete
MVHLIVTVPALLTRKHELMLLCARIGYNPPQSPKA